MPDFLLIIKLTLKTFSLRKGSLHFPSLKRILMVFLVLPIIFLIIITNQFYLLLDNFLFPSFKKTKIKKAAFVVGVPRSGTTFMYELLSKDNEQFTYFKLWELVFAPSICQKIIALGINKIDHSIGRPLYRLSLKLDQIIFGDFRDIHRMGFSLPEEDEALLIYHFSALYLYYLYPEAKEIKPYIFFDNELSEKKKKRIMQFYYRCVQRHEFVFNKKGDKIFLSKNPAFIAKIDSLGKTFEAAHIIYMLRSPIKTIPSTISLNEHIFNVFSKVIPNKDRNKESKEIVLGWYEMSLEALADFPESRKLIIPFDSFVKEPEKELENICKLLKWKGGNRSTIAQKELIVNHRNYKSKHDYDRSLGIEENDKRMEKIIRKIEQMSKLNESTNPYIRNS